MYPHPHRTDRDDIIRDLAKEFPKCIFTEPKLRLPVKHDIVDDLEKRSGLNRDVLLHTVSWYQSHLAYRYSLVAGAARLDLDGNKAGVVTPQEEQASRLAIAAINRERRALQAVQANGGPAAVPRAPAVIGEANGHRHTMTKITTNVANGAATAPSPHPSLAEVQDAIGIVSNILTDKEYASLRPVLATAALREIVAKVEKLIGSLQSEGE